MKITLIAANAKYPHTNPAIRGLKSAVKKDGFDIALKEFTINTPLTGILDAMYEPDTDVYGFSAYIWNIDMLMKLASAVKALNPGAVILFGGPEVSFETRDFMCRNACVDYVIAGEGEAVFAAFLDFLNGEIAASNVPSLYYREGREIRENTPARPVDLSELPFPYEDLGELKNRVIYYESSRGCPYNCSFCLSSAAEGVRYLPVERVKRDIDRLLEAGVMKVKFVDRTFNADKRRARDIISHIIEHAGNTGFHFEISASLLDDETIALLNKSPKGLIQVEAGVQSVNAKTLQAVNRHERFDKIAENMQKIIAGSNIHTHIDLIAGLPYEGYSEFAESFDRAFFLRADNLQLGFLKLLKGCGLRADAQKYGIVHEPYAPYTVLKTNELSFSELRRLRSVEEALSRLYNSRLLKNAAYYLAGVKKSAFRLFEDMGETFDREYEGEIGQTDLFELLFRYAVGFADENVTKNMLRLDFCLNMGRKAFPPFLKDERSEDLVKDIRAGRMKTIFDGYPYTNVKGGRVQIFDIDIMTYMRSGRVKKEETLAFFDEDSNKMLAKPLNLV